MRVSTLRGRSISPVGDLAFVCRFAAFSDSLSTIPENSFTILTCVLASILTQVKQLTFEKLGSLFSSCPNQLARSANTIKVLCSRNPIKNNIKNRYSGNFCSLALYNFLAKSATRRRMDCQFACRKKRRIEGHEKHNRTGKTRQLAIQD